MKEGKKKEEEEEEEEGNSCSDYSAIPEPNLLWRCSGTVYAL